MSSSLATKGRKVGTITGAWKERFLRSQLERINEHQRRDPVSSRQTHREDDGKEIQGPPSLISR